MISYFFKILIILALLIVVTARCDTLNRVDIGSQAENNITPPEYSRVNQQVYRTYATPITPKTPNYTVPPLPKLPPITQKTVPVPFYDVSPTEALDKEAYSKPITLKAAPAPSIPHNTAPTVKTVIEGDEPVAYRTQIYSVPKSIVETYSAPVENDNKDAVPYSSGYVRLNSESTPVKYQPEEYAGIPIDPTYVPPVAVYNPYPSEIRRSYFTPAYNNRIYPRFYNVGRPVYRTLRYGGPVAYPVPSVRNLAYGYPTPSGAVRFYGYPNIAYDIGIPQVLGNSFVNGEDDEFSKKKK